MHYELVYLDKKYSINESYSTRAERFGLIIQEEKDMENSKYNSELYL